MEYRQLKYFLKICEIGSISGAAKRLYISQQALSKSMDQLEKELGVPLFIRSSKGLSLTRYGETLKDGGGSLMRRQDSLLHELQSQKEAAGQSLSIAFFSGMFTQYPQDFLEDFFEAHADTEFRFYSYYDNEHSREYMNAGVDLFFASAKLEHTDMELLYDSHLPLYLMLSEAHPLARKNAISIKDLRGEYVININSEFPERDRIRQILAENGVEIRSVLGDADAELANYLIRNKNAVTFFAGPERMLPEGMVRRALIAEDFEYRTCIYGRKDLCSQTADELVQQIIRFREDIADRGKG